MKKIFKILVVVGLTLLLAGCPATNSATFVNASDQPVKLVFLDGDSLESLDEVVVAGNGKMGKRIPDLLSRPMIIEGYGASGTRLFASKIEASKVSKLIGQDGRITLEVRNNQLFFR